ncbi:MAG TPA: carboxypeptidase-like regulatory domain-containing protein, partial [Stellaceae bacterium]|nr:carboxypeptidase-like regulatory domain-containing protein [Stellaceae bacterium]
MRIFFAALFLLLGMGVAQADTTTLSGTVSSSAEGKMEGVLVSATKADNSITVTVVSDAQGRYRFPETKLPPGP